MLLKKDEVPEIDYLEAWPSHYYEIKTAAEKKEYLKKAMEEKLDSQYDKYRLKFLERRYFQGNTSGQVDAFMHAWVMMKATAATDVSVFQKRRLQKEWRGFLRELCLMEFVPENDAERKVLVDEWNDFARSFLEYCIGSKSYRSVLFGVLTMKDDSLALKIAEEIQLVTGTFPEKLGMKAEMAPLRQILADTYLGTIANGETYWAEAQRTKRL